MAERQRNTIVGAFAALGVVVLFILVGIFGGGRSLFASTYDVNVHFGEGVIGVQEGQGVTLNGKRVGETKAVDFWDNSNLATGVKVILAVDGGYSLPASSRVEVFTSIMGFGRPQIRIVVDATDKTRLPQDGTAQIAGRMIPILDQLLPGDMQRTMNVATERIGNASQQIGELATALKPVAEELARLMQKRDLADVDLSKVTANMDTLIQRLDLTLRNLNAVIGDPANRDNFKATLASFRQMSESGAAMLADGKVVMADAGDLVRRLAGTTDGLSLMLKNLNQMLDAVNRGEGTVPLLLRDNRLYEELVLSSRRMTAMLDDMREVLDLAKKGQLRIKAF